MSNPSSLLALLSQSWTFLRKQPVLSSVLFWFMIVPGTLMEWIVRFGLPKLSVLLSLKRQWQLTEFFCVLALILLALIVLWGETCLLFIGRRMIQNKAGRARTSLRTVSSCALPLVGSLLLTGLLQLCSLFYRSLFFVIPALLAIFLLPIPTALLLRGPTVFLLILLLPTFLFLVRSTFFPVAIVCEGSPYRSALRRSIDITRGKLTTTVLDLLALFLITLLPGALIFWSLHTLSNHWPLAAVLGAAFLASIAVTVSITFCTFGLIALYGKLRSLPHGERRKDAPQRVYA